MRLNANSSTTSPALAAAIPASVPDTSDAPHPSIPEGHFASVSDGEVSQVLISTTTAHNLFSGARYLSASSRHFSPAASNIAKLAAQVEASQHQFSAMDSLINEVKNTPRFTPSDIACMKQEIVRAPGGAPLITFSDTDWARFGSGSGASAITSMCVEEEAKTSSLFIRLAGLLVIGLAVFLAVYVNDAERQRLI